jgi:hypothetical protein
MAILKITLDLSSLLKKVEPDRKRRVAFTPFINNDSVKREFGKQVIDFILERTNSGKDKDGEAFKKYSTAYRKSLQFKVYKGNQRKVDLNLTGSMQSSIDVIKLDGPKVTIGFIDKEDEQKALGHINGANDLPIRNFWGISLEDQYKIFKDIISDVASETEIAEIIEEETRTFKPLASDGTSFDIEQDDE